MNRKAAGKARRNNGLSCSLRFEMFQVVAAKMLPICYLELAA